MATPAMPPLSALPADYVSAYSGGRLMGTLIAFSILEIVFVCLRFWSKATGRVPRGIDDWFVVAGLVFCLAVNVCALLSIELGGVGYHFIVIAQTTPKKIIAWAKILAIIPTFYNGAVTFPKLGILVFYSRIFTRGWTRIATYALMGFITSAAIATTIASYVQCIPFEYFWNKSIEGHCFDSVAYNRYGLLPQTISDVLMMLLPMPTIWALQSPLRTKIGITSTFLTGSIGLVASILRTVTFFKRDFFVDATWTGVNMWIWVCVEPGSYLIASCLVCMRPLLHRMTGRSVDGKSRQPNPFFSLGSLRTLLRSTRNGTVTSDIGAPVALEEASHESLPMPQIKVERQFAYYTDEEMLVSK